jgi:hypothetical protein
MGTMTSTKITTGRFNTVRLLEEKVTIAYHKPRQVVLQQVSSFLVETE